MLKIYIISLAHDIDKRANIKAALDAMCIKYEFIDAVYGRELDETIFLNLSQDGILKKRGYSATLGEIGCSISHTIALKKIITENVEWGCILEDDVILDHRFKNFYENFYKVSHDTNTLYLLGGQEGLITRHLFSKSVIYRKYIGELIFHKVMYTEKYVTRACAYVISNQACHRYLSLYIDKFFLTDNWDYLIRKKVFQQIFFSSFVKHPIDLSKSNLEKERLLGYKNTKGFKDHFIYKLLSKISFIMKFMLSILKKYLP